MSPREVAREFEAATARQRDALDRDLALAWHIEMLARQKKLPDLKRLLGSRTGKQTAQEQRSTLAILSAQYGIPLRKRGEKAPMTKRRSKKGR